MAPTKYSTPQAIPLNFFFVVGWSYCLAPSYSKEICNNVVRRKVFCCRHSETMASLCPDGLDNVSLSPYLQRERRVAIANTTLFQLLLSPTFEVAGRSGANHCLPHSIDSVAA